MMYPWDEVPADGGRVSGVYLWYFTLATPPSIPFTVGLRFFFLRLSQCETCDTIIDP